MTPSLDDRSRANRVVIVVQGGLVQAICADRPAEVQVLVVDYDREGVSPAALVRIPQAGGGTAEAVVTAWTPELPAVTLESLFGLIEQGGDPSPPDGLKGKGPPRPSGRGTSMKPITI